jgi:uncharacterized membrane protein
MGATAERLSRSLYEPGPATPARGPRIQALDVIRGAVMILMAVDHVRVFSGVPAGGPTAGVFFTRWITHFAAPAFAFFAGTGAFLHGQKLGDRGALARFLATRGLVLVTLELTVLRLAWTFNTDVASYNIAGVLWMLGWCMALLAGLVWLPTRAIGALGVVIIAAQDLLGGIANARPSWIWHFLYSGGQVRLGANGPPIDILYSIVPWIGVMAVGYAFGAVMLWPTARRDRACIVGGLAATAVFLAVSIFSVAGHAAQDGAPPALFRVLAQRKYPASQLFLLMTLGPTIALLPLADRARGLAGNVLSTFGRVPLFFYLLHIPTIHLAALVVSRVREGAVNPWLFGNHPMEPPPLPPGYRWSLPLLYLVFVLCVAALYFPCRWYAGLKARRRDPWLSYL